MGSKKPSARRREREAFEAQVPILGSAFAAERQRQDADREQRAQALRYKACDRKVRYGSKAEAKAAAAACERHGARSLHFYQCPYCGGWHLTHKPKR